MKTQEQIKQELGNLSQYDLEKIELLIALLGNFKGQGKISTDGFKSLSNIERELWCLKESYSNKLINLLKQGTII